MISALKVSEHKTLRFGLAAGGSVLVGVGVGMLLTAAREHPVELWDWSVELFWRGRLLLVAGGVCMVIGLVLWRPRFCELYVGRTRFGFRDQTQDPDLEYELADFVGVDSGHVQLAGGLLVEIPPLLRARSREIERALRHYQAVARSQAFGVEIPAAHDWNFQFSNEAPMPPPPPVTEFSQIDSDHALQGLIGQYRHAIIFRDALPSACALAKMFSRFKQSNGGLALFGVRPDARLVGLPAAEVDGAADRLKALGADLTNARVEVGRIELGGKLALFAVFNPIQSHTKPLKRFEGELSEVSVV